MLLSAFITEAFALGFVKGAVLVAAAYFIVAAVLGELRRQHEQTRRAYDQFAQAVRSANKNHLVLKPVLLCGNDVLDQATDRAKDMNNCGAALSLLSVQVQLLDRMRHGSVDLQRVERSVDEVLAPVIGNRPPEKSPPLNDTLAEQVLRQSAHHVLKQLETL